MKNICKKLCRRVLAILVVSTIILFTACGKEDKNGTERFYELKNNVDITSTTYELIVLNNTKNICKQLLIKNNIKVKDLFIYAYSMDGQCYAEAHVLTEDSEYKVFRIKTKMIGPLYTALTKGYAGNYQRELEKYLYNVDNPTLNENYIIFD